jgi:hypothetical protein
MTDLYLKARAETAVLLGYVDATLTAEQTTRFGHCDCVAVGARRRAGQAPSR